jgi:hypothetical protein
MCGFGFVYSDNVIQCLSFCKRGGTSYCKMFRLHLIQLAIAKVLEGMQSKLSVSNGLWTCMVIFAVM